MDRGVFEGSREEARAEKLMREVLECSQKFVEQLAEMVAEGAMPPTALMGMLRAYMIGRVGIEKCSIMSAEDLKLMEQAVFQDIKHQMSEGSTAALLDLMHEAAKILRSAKEGRGDSAER